MSIKHFCDCCHKEIERNVVSDRPKGDTVLRGVRIQVEVTSGVGDAWNAGDLCKSCLWSALDLVLNPPRAASVA
jgi:hypothetical protein